MALQEDNNVDGGMSDATTRYCLTTTTARTCMGPRTENCTRGPVFLAVLLRGPKSNLHNLQQLRPQLYLQDSTFDENSTQIRNINITRRFVNSHTLKTY